MEVFFAITTGIGTAMGAWLGFAIGHHAGSRAGFARGRDQTRDTFERIIALARAELIARDAGGSEMADLVLSLLRESN